jgi:hypothetical protein
MRQCRVRDAEADTDAGDDACILTEGDMVVGAGVDAALSLALPHESDVEPDRSDSPKSTMVVRTSTLERARAMSCGRSRIPLAPQRSARSIAGGRAERAKRLLIHSDNEND